MDIASADSGAGPRPDRPDEGPSDLLRTLLEHALGAQYTVLRLLGRGGMGAVYLARERLLERLVAIKVLPSEHADAESRERFLREARTAAQLSHANIVPLLSFGELGDTLFYIMRFVDGESLETRLRRDGALPPAEARRILLELSDALGYAHEQGVVHRDIKPDNVLLERGTGRVMLTDFGVARRAASTATLTGTGMIVGTPQYMSPEQASGERTVDGRSDLYGLGVMGYRMIAGRLPFAGDSVREVLVQHITQAPQPIGELAPDAPLDLTSAVMKCLAKDPELRWADAASLRFALAASTSETPALPDELDQLPRLGTRLLGWGYVFLGAVSCIRIFDADPVWLRLGAGLPLAALAIGVGPLVALASRRGISWRTALSIAFWPSQGWSGWWPRRLRPPGDVWVRLPAVVRRARVWGITSLTLSFAGVTLPLLVSAILWGSSIRAVAPLVHKSLAYILMASVLAPLVALMVPALLLERFGKQRGLSKPETKRLLSEPTSGSRFWERPSIARLLDDERPESRVPDTAIELAAAVRELAGALSPDVGTLASEAVHAADELSAAIRDLDAQHAQLDDPADAGEQKRIEDRLASLGTEHADEPAPKRQMRALLEGQVALLRDLDSRRAAIHHRRALLHEQLRTLWLQLANLQAQGAAPAMNGTELSGRIRQLCRDIEQRVAAVEETNRLTET